MPRLPPQQLRVEEERDSILDRYGQPSYGTQLSDSETLLPGSPLECSESPPPVVPAPAPGIARRRFAFRRSRRIRAHARNARVQSLPSAALATGLRLMQPQQAASGAATPGGAATAAPAANRTLAQPDSQGSEPHGEASSEEGSDGDEWYDAAELRRCAVMGWAPNTEHRVPYL